MNKIQYDAYAADRGEPTAGFVTVAGQQLTPAEARELAAALNDMADHAEQQCFECVRCGRRIAYTDIGPTFNGEPLWRWAPTDRAAKLVCPALVWSSGYCSPGPERPFVQ